MEGGSPELKTFLWVLSGWPSLEARVTSVKSAVHDERGSAQALTRVSLSREKSRVEREISLSISKI